VRETIVEHGEVQVSWKVIGFKKIKFYTAENVGYGDVNLPVQEMHTTSYWFTVPQDLLDALQYSRADLVDGLLGVANVMHTLAAVALMCDLRDVETCIGDKSSRWFVRHVRGERTIFSSSDRTELDAERMDAFDPTIFLFDNYPGGIGFSEELFGLHERLLVDARQLISSCPCEAGCPSCVGPAGEMGLKSKEVALAVLDRIA
jgi:DEAD/DEAH box helicase domain-containing protein